jgi:hypothetical protein
MSEPISTSEIADLMRRIRHLTENRPTDPVEQAEVLALKADLLSRIANQRAEEQGQCESTTELREIADEAHAIAANARRLIALHPRHRRVGPRHTRNPPPF